MRVLLAASLLLAVWAHDGARQKRTYPSRCFPGTHCWPSNEAIAELDKATAGSVLQPSSSSYRSNVLYVNERLTKHPGLILEAQTADDVRKGVLFARKFHLLLSVQGANAQTYDYTGRLSNDGGFVIDVSSLRSVVATVLTSANAAGSVTVQSGATWQDVYSEVENSGRVVVGTNPTDGVYETTLTGGISPLSRSLGLVSDNLLSAQVVLADGRLATVSAAGAIIEDNDGETLTYDNPELFNALRGGGFNWAIPVSFTFRLHFPPFQMASVNAVYKIYVDGTFLGRDALKFVLREITSLPSQWGGYIMVDGAPSSLDPADKGSVTLNLLHYGPWSGTGVTSIFNLQQYAPTLVRERFNVDILDNYQQYRTVAGENDVFNSWPNMYIDNILVQSNVFSNNTKLDEFVETLLGVVNTPTVDSNIRCIGRLMGGQISAQADNNDALTGEYRDAVMSMTCGLTWRDSILKEDYYVTLATSSADSFRQFGKGVDPRFAPENLEDWKSEVYGSKYSSLLETKSRWDVDNFLWVHNHIASDFRLNCRYGRCH